MDVMRQLAAAAAVVLLAVGALLAVRCHTKGLIGKKRLLAIGAAALCFVLAAAGIFLAFVPRAIPVEPQQTDAGADAVVEQRTASEHGDQGTGGEASVTSDGRVVYRASAPEVEPADSELPAREDGQNGSVAPREGGGDQSDATEQGGARQEGAGQGLQEDEVQQADQEVFAQPDSSATSQQQTHQDYPAVVQPSGDSWGQPRQAPPGQTATAPSGLQTVSAAAPTGSLRLDFLPGGVCTLAVLPDSTAVLVGAGGSDDADAVLAHLSALGVSEIDYLVLTGPEEECCGGAARVLSHVRVGSLLVPSSRDGGPWAEVEAEAARAGVQVAPVGATLEVSFGGGAVAAIPAGDDHLVVRASCGGSGALLPGCTDPAAAVAASPGRADVLDATGWAQGCNSLAQAARGLWPDVAVVATDAAEGSLKALAMAREVEAGNAGFTITMGPDGSLSASR